MRLGILGAGPGKQAADRGEAEEGAGRDRRKSYVNAGGLRTEPRRSALERPSELSGSGFAVVEFVAHEN